jgi:MoaA/NifB/PqqE/SkfB family radical SAM enzyme
MRQGSRFFGILGGEPLMHRGLFDLMERHPDAYFLLFTNGTLLTDEHARRMRRMGNVSPLVSVEGMEQASDERRGGSGIYARTMAGIEHCRRNRLITGVATSLCRNNFNDLASDAFLQDMARRGVHYVWYYIYRPVGEMPSPDLALSAAQISALRRFLVESRRRAPLLVVDAYWDQDGAALCPAATGISHHISPDGFVEPCPPVQLAAERIGDGTDLFERVAGSRFLRDFRELAARTTRGCILMERPDLLARLARESGALDSSGRAAFLREMAALSPVPSHHQPGGEVPEKSPPYRLGKRSWFFGLGAYG